MKKKENEEKIVEFYAFDANFDTLFSTTISTTKEVDEKELENDFKICFKENIIQHIIDQTDFKDLFEREVDFNCPVLMKIFNGKTGSLIESKMALAKIKVKTLLEINLCGFQTIKDLNKIDKKTVKKKVKKKKVKKSIICRAKSEKGEINKHMKADSDAIDKYMDFNFKVVNERDELLKR